MNEMIRISENEFIRKNLISYDVNTIDEVLETICPNEYLPLKDVNLFLHFPNIGYQWNSFVLESYLFSHSQAFKLIHVSFSNTDTCGAMVRADSPISDYRTLVVDVLSHSNTLSTTNSALQFLVDKGYQQRKSLSGIDQILKEAKLKKEHRENNKK